MITQPRALRMGKGIGLRPIDVANLGQTVELFSGKKCTLNGFSTFEFKTLFIDGKATKIMFNYQSLEAIFTEIERVVDPAGVVIATRLNTRGRLLSTGKGTGKAYFKPSELRIYNALKNELQEC